jgi:hypothetical protein
MKRRFSNLFLTVALACTVSISAFAQVSIITKKELSQTEIDKIVKAFTTKEGEFREALKNYVFNRKAIVHTIGFGGQITGEYRRESYMSFSQDGSRTEKILFFPISTLKELEITLEDIEDLGGVNPFALEPAAISQYNFQYLGVEKIDELDLYVFEVSPKILPDPKKSKVRLFTGRVWVDTQDVQIVKSKGKGVPEGKQRFPIVETWREHIDGKYWFPTYSSVNDELVFDSGQTVKMKMKVTYTNYRQGKSEVRILDDEPEPTPTPTPKKP